MSKHKHGLKIKNDFGTVVWDEGKELAFRLLIEDAWTLQMTPGEFANMLAESDRQCPKCKAGKH